MSTSQYARSGVDTTEADRALSRLLLEVTPTQAFGARSEIGIGHFAAVIRVGPLQLALTTDGVGTKLLVAEEMGRYDTVGIDCIGMNVNDLICVGATPLTMLDYIAVENSDPEVFAQLGRGLAEGAKQAGVSIIGGETAIVPEMVKGVVEGRGLDLVGMALGIVDEGALLDGSAIEPGDVVIGVASNGLHSNGYTLARRVLLGEWPIDQYVPEFEQSVGEELLRPVTIYVPHANALRDAKVRVRAIAHITGDGLLNLRRVEAAVGYEITDLPEPPPVFQLIEKIGGIERAEMRTVFNMGIGLTVTVAPGDTDKALEALHACGSDAWVLGKAVADPERKVLLPGEGLIGHSKLFVREGR